MVKGGNLHFFSTLVDKFQLKLRRREDYSFHHLQIQLRNVPEIKHVKNLCLGLTLKLHTATD